MANPKPGTYYLKAVNTNTRDAQYFGGEEQGYVLWGGVTQTGRGTPQSKWEVVPTTTGKFAIKNVKFGTYISAEPKEGTSVVVRPVEHPWSQQHWEQFSIRKGSKGLNLIGANGFIIGHDNDQTYLTTYSTVYDDICFEFEPC